MKCPEPGIYRCVPAAVYHSWEAVSSSLLKGYAELPSTAQTPYEPGDDANVGSGIHAFTLQGKAGLEAECFILPASCDGKGKTALAERADYAEKYPERSLLPSVYGTGKIPVMEVLEGVDFSFKVHPKTGPILADSEKELSLVWADKTTGSLCKARLDIWEARCRTIWDIKKSRDITRFQWQIKELFYEVQAGHYFNGAVACGLNPVAFGFLPCEAFPPYRVGCGYLSIEDPDKLTAASLEAVRLVGLVTQSQQTGYWPNFQIPAHVYDLGNIQPDDLIQVW